MNRIRKGKSKKKNISPLFRHKYLVGHSRAHEYHKNELASGLHIEYDLLDEGWRQTNTQTDKRVESGESAGVREGGTWELAIF